MKYVREQKPRTAALLDGSYPERLDGSELQIRLPERWDFQRRQLEGAQKKPVEEALDTFFGHPLRAGFIVAPASGGGGEKSATRKVYEDPSVRKVLESFNGGIVSVEGQDASALRSTHQDRSTQPGSAVPGEMP